jgi:hypothetical protein
MDAFRFLAAVAGTLAVAYEINPDLLIHSGFLAARHIISKIMNNRKHTIQEASAQFHSTFSLIGTANKSAFRVIIDTKLRPVGLLLREIGTPAFQCSYKLY